MKARLLLAILFVLSQALVLTGGVTAQGSQPPVTPSLGEPFARHLHAANLASNPGAASTVPLGQPGTSFRYVQTFGVTDEAYQADVQHINRPFGLFVDGGDNLYVVENAGRLLKYNSSGTNLFAIGTAGLEFRDNYVFTYPQDAAVDGSGNMWVVDANRAVEYSSSGLFLQNIPAADPWQNGSDNQHFDNPSGIAFDTAGRMYVSDFNNQRIQVFSFSGSTPVYSTTIGVTGVLGTDNNHFNYPGHIALDSTDRLYVADNNNHRVQRCTFAAGWTCSPFVGVSGTPGSDLTHLNFAYGIAIGPGNTTYIADSSNDRVLKCDTTPVCTVFAGVTGVHGSDNTHLGYTIDVAADSSGNVYVADIDNYRVQKFNSLGQYQSTLGVNGVPYVPDTSHYYAPAGITVTGDGSLYFSEDRGHRVVKLDAAGAQQWTYGVAGVYGTDNAHLGAFWGGGQGSPAVDAGGHVYVPDTPNGRIQILDANGNYFTTFGSAGQGNNQFSGPQGVFIRPSDGSIYVVDSWNNRVQVFNSNRVYQATLGVTSVSGSDNGHFNFPTGVTVDGSGNIFVADANNYRVQKCTLVGSTGTCTTFAGQTGVQGNDFGHFQHPMAVAADSVGRLYVVDEWNQRVQVFDPSGAYLTTIGESYGASSGQARDPSGVAVDSSNNVYVTDRNDQRIQKFALGVPGWRQTNITGFGNPNAAIPSLAVFSNYLYAGTANYNDHVFHVWRTPDGSNWQPAGTTDFGGGVSHMIAFSNTLYAGTWSADVWRSSDGLGWTHVISGGFGDGTNSGIARFSVYNGMLYGATWNSTAGTQIWRTSNGTSWTQFGASGLGDPNNDGAVASEIFGGKLYFGIHNYTGPAGAQLWRTDGLTITAVITDGFGDSNNKVVSALATFNGNLYAAIVNGAGVKVLRSANGTAWSPAASGGFGNPNTNGESGLEVLDGELYLVAENDVTGAEVWRSPDGTQWTQVGFAGFGNSNNQSPVWGSSTTVFQGHLFIGVEGWVTGGQIWQLLKLLYLPLVRH